MSTNKTVSAMFDVPVTPTSNDCRYESLPIEYRKEDVTVLRALAKEYMECASSSAQNDTVTNWKKLNDLERVRPMLWHNELPWHEMNVNDELTIKTSSPFTRRIEEELRRRLYLWKHMRADMVLEPIIYSPMIIDNSGIGLTISEEIAVSDASNNIVGHKFIPVIQEESDLEKISLPKIQLNHAETQATYEGYQEIFDGILPVAIKGAEGFWFAPIDDVVMFMGANELLINLIEQPELVHAAMQKICDAYMSALDQYEALGCIAGNAKNCRVGSGAYGYSSKLEAGTATGMKCNQIWGACASQYFTSVSAAMQEEFCLPYEQKWLARFGYSYYGCCERLDHKIDVLSQIPNLRKISCSPWSDPARMAEAVGRKYVVSLKPNPAVFAGSSLDEEYVIKDLTERLNALKNCNVEIIIKDISTVNYRPEQLWRWIEIATAICRNLI